MWRKGLFTRYLRLFRSSRCQARGADPPPLRSPRKPAASARRDLCRRRSFRKWAFLRCMKHRSAQRWR